jgi:hypothetical protein
MTQASIAICPTHNAKGNRDVTGAFLPEARAFSELRAAEGMSSLLRQFDNSRRKSKRRREVEAILDAAPYPLKRFHPWQKMAMMHTPASEAAAW